MRCTVEGHGNASLVWVDSPGTIATFAISEARIARLSTSLDGRRAGVSLWIARVGHRATDARRFVVRGALDALVRHCAGIARLGAGITV